MEYARLASGSSVLSVRVSQTCAVQTLQGVSEENTFPTVAFPDETVRVLRKCRKPRPRIVGRHATETRRVRESRAMSVSPSSGSEIEEAILDDVGGSDVSPDAGCGAFAPYALSGETRPGGESGSGGSARGHSETYSDDFGSGDDGFSGTDAFLDEPVDDVPESPAAKAPSRPNAFATRGDPSAQEETRRGARSAVPARAAAGTCARDASDAVTRASSEGGSDSELGRSGASSPRVFRWERSPSPDHRALVASTRRPEPAWASVPGRVAALVARARALSARRDTVAAMSPAARAVRRYENDPAPIAVSPLTMAKVRAHRIAEVLRAEAAAVRASVAARAAAHRARVTPDLARAMYVRRAMARAIALDGARAVEDLESEAALKSRELRPEHATGSADDWYDDTSGGFGEALDAFARVETSEDSQNAVRELRASAELRRRARGVLTP